MKIEPLINFLIEVASLTVRSLQTISYLILNLRGLAVNSGSLINIKELCGSNINSYKLINLTFNGNQQNLELYGRLTNSTVLPRCDLRGRQRTTMHNASPESYLVKLTREVNDSFQVNPVEVDTKSSNLEDPRYFKWNESEFLICTELVCEDKSKWSSQITVIEIPSKISRQISSPLNLTIEKNWIPWPLSFEYLEFVYSSIPFAIVTVDLIGREVQLKERENHGHNAHRFAYHGGSNFIKCLDGTYVRLARRRLRLFKYGLVHVHYFLQYDSQLNLLFESQPFLFTGFGFETCNSIQQNFWGFRITWTEDDIKSFIAEIRIESFRSWLETNQREKIFQIPLNFLQIVRLLFVNRERHYARGALRISWNK